MSDFDYQGKVWGGSQPRLSLTYLAYPQLRYCLGGLKATEGRVGSTGSPPRVLDVGCGGGGFAKAIKFYRPDLEVHGVDISKPAIGFAKKEPCGVTFRVGDVYNLPHSDNFFEAVVLGELLEHLEDPRRALREMARVLKPGGIFHAAVPLEGEPFSLIYWLDRKLGWRLKERFSGHIQELRSSQLEEMLEAIGLKVIEKRYGYHCLRQVADLIFHVLLALRGKELSVGLEQYLMEKRGLLAKLTRSAASVLTVVLNFETLVFSFFPGGEVFILCRKEK